VSYANISEVTIKFYFIDLEILFSRSPFIKQNIEDFSFVIPNFQEAINLEKQINYQTLKYEIPSQYATQNIFIEVSNKSNKQFETYFSTSLNVTISESLGEVTVLNHDNKSLSKVYSKVFAQMKDGTVKFYKDGYTDLRGRFNYLELNTGELGNISKMAIFIMHDDLGSIIKEANLPNNIGGTTTDVTKPVASLDYEQLQQHKQNMRGLWRCENKVASKSKKCAY